MTHPPPPAHDSFAAPTGAPMSGAPMYYYQQPPQQSPQQPQSWQSGQFPQSLSQAQYPFPHQQVPSAGQQQQPPQYQPQYQYGYGYGGQPMPPTGPSGGGGTYTRGPYNESVYTSAKPAAGAGAGNGGGDSALAEETTVTNSPKAVRLGFIRKVFGIVSVQLAFSMGCIALCLYHDGVRHFVQTTPTLLWVAMAATIGITIAMACVPSLHQTYPTNMFMLGLFTLFQGYLLGVIASFYETTAVMQAVLVTAVITTCLSLYGLQTKRDLSKMGSFLFVALICLIMFGFLRLLFPASAVVETVYACVGALIFSAYLVYDTWLIANVLGPDDYVIAALRIYLDIIDRKSVV